MFKFGGKPAEKSITSVEQARDPRIRVLFDYWTSKCAGRPMPSRADIDPIDIPKLLPWISLLDVIPDVPIEKRYRMRLFGTQLVEFHQRDWTGRSIFEMTTPEAAQRLAQAGEFVVNHRQPWISSGNFYWASHKAYRKFEVLILPLSRDGTNVNMLLAITLVFA